MAGIGDINKKRQDVAKNMSSGGIELFLRDGDQAFVAIVPTGESNDERLCDYYRHTIQSESDGAKRFDFPLCKKTIDQHCEYCSKGLSPQHRFAFWTYTYYILHSEKRNDEWVEVIQKSGGTLYKEEVNEFRMFTQGFGRGDSLWNQLVDIFNDHESLNKYITRIKRVGSGLNDTAYSISALVNSIVKFPSQIKAESEELPSALDYFIKRDETQKQEIQPVSKDKDVDLPGGKDEVDEAFDESTDELF